MSSDSTVKLLIDYIRENQAGGNTVFNNAVNLIDAILQLAVLKRNRTTPELSANGNIYHLASSGCSGDFAGQDGKIAYYYDGWYFVTPNAGWRMFDEETETEWLYDGTNWLLKSSTGVSFNYEFDSELAEVDPGPGKFRLNLADLSTATEIYVDDESLLGYDVSGLMNGAEECNIVIKNVTTAGNMIYYNVTAVSNESGYTKFTVTFDKEVGTPEVLSNEDKVELLLDFTGEADHNNLVGLQGGTTDEYYHLTSAFNDFVSAGAIRGLQFSFQFDKDSVNATDMSVDPGG